MYGREKLKGKNRGKGRREKRIRHGRGVSERGGRIGNAAEGGGEGQEMGWRGGKGRGRCNANANSEFRVAIYAELSPDFRNSRKRDTRHVFFRDARKTTRTTTATTTTTMTTKGNFSACDDDALNKQRSRIKLVSRRTRGSGWERGG